MFLLNKAKGVCTTFLFLFSGPVTPLLSSVPATSGKVFPATVPLTSSYSDGVVVLSGTTAPSEYEDVGVGTRGADDEDEALALVEPASSSSEQDWAPRRLQSESCGSFSRRAATTTTIVLALAGCTTTLLPSQRQRFLAPRQESETVTLNAMLVRPVLSNETRSWPYYAQDKHGNTVILGSDPTEDNISLVCCNKVKRSPCSGSMNHAEIMEGWEEGGWEEEARWGEQVGRGIFWR